MKRIIGTLLGAVLLAVSGSFAPVMLHSALAAGCSLTYVITPYDNTEHAAQSSAQANCGTNQFTLTVEEELYRWSGSAWLRVSGPTDDYCHSCNAAVVVIQHGCSGSALTSYFARARFQYPDVGWGWSGWTSTVASSLRCG